VALLDTVPGIDQKTAEVILAEMGLDMSQFPTDKHLAAWAGLAPGNHQSGGKRYAGRTRQGNQTLKSTLVQAAWSATRTKDTFLKARYHRLAARRGKKRTIVAAAHAMLVSIWHMLTYRQPYQELGGDYFYRSVYWVRTRVPRRLYSGRDAGRATEEFTSGARDVARGRRASVSGGVCGHTSGGRRLTMGKYPLLKPREVATILHRLRFVEVRQRGSHRQYRHSDGWCTTTNMNGGMDEIHPYSRDRA
jgi:predicted RNA binding protein YcfA (HicA-like mRNA interferase family)